MLICYVAGASLSKENFRVGALTSNEISRYDDELADNSLATSISSSRATSCATSPTASGTRVTSPTASGTTPRPSPVPFTPRQLSASIAASENLRLLSSVVIALWAILSHHGYLLGANFSPLFVVMLTDVSIIFGLLLLDKANKNKSEEADKANKNKGEEAVSLGKEGSGWSTNIGGILEAVILFQQAASAIFMDCCICMIITICGVA